MEAVQREIQFCDKLIRNYGLIELMAMKDVLKFIKDDGADFHTMQACIQMKLGEVAGPTDYEGLNGGK